MLAFADGTKCFMKTVSEFDIHKFQEFDIHKLQEDLSSVSEWTNNNKLSLSIPKFIFILLQKI